MPNIRKIIREEVNEFDWAKDVKPMDENVVYMALNLGEPDLDDIADIMTGEPNWVYWSAYFYVTIDEYITITGDYEIKTDWTEWNIRDNVEGRELLKKYYENGFDKKQEDDNIISGDTDGSITIIDKHDFCYHVGRFNTDIC